MLFLVFAMNDNVLLALYTCQRCLDLVLVLFGGRVNTKQ